MKDQNTIWMIKEEIQIKFLKYWSPIFSYLFKRVWHNLTHCGTRLHETSHKLLNSGIRSRHKEFPKPQEKTAPETHIEWYQTSDSCKESQFSWKEEKIMYFEILGALICIHKKPHLSAVFSMIWLSELRLPFLFNTCWRLTKTVLKMLPIQVTFPRFLFGLFACFTRNCQCKTKKE